LCQDHACTGGGDRGVFWMALSVVMTDKGLDALPKCMMEGVEPL
jgi:hypothetical protein